MIFKKYYIYTFIVTGMFVNMCGSYTLDEVFSVMRKIDKKCVYVGRTRISKKERKSLNNETMDS